MGLADLLPAVASEEKKKKKKVVKKKKVAAAGAFGDDDVDGGLGAGLLGRLGDEDSDADDLEADLKARRRTRADMEGDDEEDRTGFASLLPAPKKRAIATVADVGGDVGDTLMAKDMGKKHGEFEMRSDMADTAGDPSASKHKKRKKKPAAAATVAAEVTSPSLGGGLLDGLPAPTAGAPPQQPEVAQTAEAPGGTEGGGNTDDAGDEPAVGLGGLMGLGGYGSSDDDAGDGVSAPASAAAMPPAAAAPAVPALSSFFTAAADEPEEARPKKSKALKKPATKPTAPASVPLEVMPEAIPATSAPAPQAPTGPMVIKKTAFSFKTRKPVAAAAGEAPPVDPAEAARLAEEAENRRAWEQYDAEMAAYREALVQQEAAEDAARAEQDAMLGVKTITRDAVLARTQVAAGPRVAAAPAMPSVAAAAAGGGGGGGAEHMLAMARQAQLFHAEAVAHGASSNDSKSRTRSRYGW